MLKRKTVEQSKQIMHDFLCEHYYEKDNPEKTIEITINKCKIKVEILYQDNMPSLIHVPIMNTYYGMPYDNKSMISLSQTIIEKSLEHDKKEKKRLRKQKKVQQKGIKNKIKTS